MGALKQQHKAVGELVGQCPLSVCDVFESLQAGTCMCLALDVERSEACINDPSLLKIKAIIPTFMAAESFIDSSVYSLLKDNQAHGGFGGNQDASLAQGVGRENITGVLPLWLFPEHWEVARRRAPPIYGLLCTADVMGYAQNQQFIIPFKVLLKASENAKENPSEMNKRIEELVLATCKAILSGFHEFRKNTRALLADFAQHHDKRTSDVVASIPVMIAQLYAL